MTHLMYITMCIKPTYKSTLLMCLINVLYKVPCEWFVKYNEGRKKVKLQMTQLMYIIMCIKPTHKSTLPMCLVNVLYEVVLKTTLDVHLMYIIMHIGNVHYQSAF
jgi:hypothetical protein